MTVDEAVSLLERLLDEAPPEPAGVWAAFREWACRPVASERDELEASIGYADGTTRVEFRRAFDDPAAEGEGYVTLRLSSSRPDAPRLGEVGERCEDRRELTAFFSRVERLPGFALALAYPHWEFDAERG